MYGKKLDDVFKIISVETLEEYIKTVSGLIDESEKELYFRGEKKYFDHMAPSIYQESVLANHSDEYYAKLKIEAVNDLHGDESFVDELAHLQHYGAKTRLLDISSNPLASLFFALDGIDENEEAYVYIFEESSVDRYGD